MFRSFLAPRLPRPRTSFVGRQAELAQARHLLAHSRLLTLTGRGHDTVLGTHTVTGDRLLPIVRQDAACPP